VVDAPGPRTEMVLVALAVGTPQGRGFGAGLPASARLRRLSFIRRKEWSSGLGGGGF